MIVIEVFSDTSIKYLIMSMMFTSFITFYWSCILLMLLESKDTLVSIKMLPLPSSCHTQILFQEAGSWRAYILKLAPFVFQVM